MRQVVLDTETTGIDPKQGHRLIEIGCIEMVNRRVTDRTYHQYIQPDRAVDKGAMEVHGITDEFLKDKPRFANIVDEFMAFIKGSELIIHNAAFDVRFIESELNRLNQSWQPISHYCEVLDTLTMARQLHPGQRNTLDALCKRYNIDNSQRQLHGALLDANLLAEVYLAMTGGQVSFFSQSEQSKTHEQTHEIKRVNIAQGSLTIIRPTEAELVAHQQCLERIDKASKGECVWLKL